MDNSHADRDPVSGGWHFIALRTTARGASAHEILARTAEAVARGDGREPALSVNLDTRDLRAEFSIWAEDRATAVLAARALVEGGMAAAGARPPEAAPQVVAERVAGPVTPRRGWPHGGGAMVVRHPAPTPRSH